MATNTEQQNKFQHQAEAEKDLLELAERSKAYMKRGKLINGARNAIYVLLAFLTYHAFGALNYLHLDKVIAEKLGSLNVTDGSDSDRGVWNVILNSTLAQFYTGTGLVAFCHLTLTLIGLLLLACFRNHKTSLVKSLYRLVKAELYDPDGKGNADESVPLESENANGLTPRVHRIRGIIDSILPLLETHGKRDQAAMDLQMLYGSNQDPSVVPDFQYVPFNRFTT